jgi:nickel/cobalt transporter (NicO) family protein
MTANEIRGRVRAALRRRGSLAAATVSLLAALLLPTGASAHPLGNFTINHYDGIRVSPSRILVDHVLDMAEIPTFSERAGMDTDSDGVVSDAEAAAYEVAHCDSARDLLDLAVSARRLALDVIETGLSFPQGQGAVTLRLVCVYAAPLPQPLMAAGETLTFADTSFAERRGWREIVVAGDGATISNSNASASSSSERLTRYPTDLLTTPSDERSATWTAVPGGFALPPLNVADAKPVGSRSVVVAATPFRVPDASPVAGQVAAGTGAATVAPAQAAVPGGINDLGGDVMAVFGARDLTLPVIALSLLVAAGLGALHAVSPGHGKTVMAAYLVGSRGGARHALGLGLTVTISHTIGVLALGVVSLSFASLVPPERLYPVLGVISGVIVVGIGLWLIAARLRLIRRERAAGLARAEAHEARGEHEHAHAHGQEPVPGSEPDPVDQAGGWHSHAGRRHSHLPARGTALSWRGLFALGLAGGMVPSVSALILLLGSISLGRPAYGIALTVAFGLGMAVVLVGVGLVLVYARGLLERLPAGGRGRRLGGILPTATAFVVLLAGLLITTQALMTLR